MATDNPRIILVHSDQPTDRVVEDVKRLLGFFPDRTLSIVGDRPMTQDGTIRFVVRSILDMVNAGRSVLIHNNDVPIKVESMNPRVQYTLIRSSQGYRNVPIELRLICTGELVEIGLKDPKLRETKYYVVSENELTRQTA